MRHSTSHEASADTTGPRNVVDANYAELHREIGK